MGRERPVENDYRDFISALNKYSKEDLIKVKRYFKRDADIKDLKRLKKE